MHEWTAVELDWMEGCQWPECHSNLLKTPVSECQLCLASGFLFPVPFGELLPKTKVEQ